ncbi:hypothetical protein DM01DRAFT_1204976 [Hesseltinella vesiculosa]|uniref:Uncharacterized protein n=1 Tax=Hesseltinella vesiculosa TaxID=101127 RepID=A0A1X2GPU4_9FUNG|nr:hypothetical protein DM01DRAFT_1204976 [Hesseltinella vesiculosa]
MQGIQPHCQLGNARLLPPSGNKTGKPRMGQTSLYFGLSIPSSGYRLGVGYPLFNPQKYPCRWCLGVKAKSPSRTHHASTEKPTAIVHLEPTQ